MAGSLQPGASPERALVMALIAFRFDSPARDSPAGRAQLRRPGPCAAPRPLPSDGAPEEEEEEEKSRAGMGLSSRQSLLLPHVWATP